MEDIYDGEDEYSSHYYDIVHSRKEYVYRNRIRKGHNRNARDIANIGGSSTITYTYDTPNTIPNSFVVSMRQQIIDNYHFLAQNGLGPRVLNILVNPDSFSITLLYEEENGNAQDIAFKIGNAVAKLHKIGKGHSNLCRSNVIVMGDVVHFISPEYMYNIDTLEEDLVTHFYAFNKYDLDLSEEDERDMYLNMDYERWSEDMYGSYKCLRRNVLSTTRGQVTLLIM